MPIIENGSNRVINDSIKGSVFPTNERDTIFTLLIDGSDKNIRIHGSVYGRSIKMLGGVRIDGPCLCRGDVKIDPQDKSVKLLSGITVNGNLNATVINNIQSKSISTSVQNASLIIRGDIVVTSNISLSNAIIFGSIKALNCRLDHCIVLGTIVVEEKLTLISSSIAGYACSKIVFEGACILIHALGESSHKPVFAPHEQFGEIINSDVRYYPILRSEHGFINKTTSKNTDYPDYSRLDPEADWVEINAQGNLAIDSNVDISQKWVLSLGGRIADFAKIHKSIEDLSNMLKCGFEYEHYHHSLRLNALNKTLENLNEDESWILKTVCEII